MLINILEQLVGKKLNITGKHITKYFHMFKKDTMNL